MKSVVNFCARLVIALVLIFAGFAKLLDPGQFARKISDFGLVPDMLVVPTAWIVIFAELLIGVLLLLRVRGSLLAAATSLVIFIGVLIYGISLGLDIDCGCFGPAVQVSLTQQLLTDCGLLVVCGIIYFTEQRTCDSPGPDSVSHSDSPGDSS